MLTFHTLLNCVADMGAESSTGCLAAPTLTLGMEASIRVSLTQLPFSDGFLQLAKSEEKRPNKTLTTPNTPARRGVRKHSVSNTFLLKEEENTNKIQLKNLACFSSFLASSGCLDSFP